MNHHNILIVDSHLNANNQTIRKDQKGMRRQRFRNVILEIYPQSADNFPVIIGGYSNNIFVGGTCVVLDTNDENISNSIATLNKTIKNSIVKPVENSAQHRAHNYL